MSPTITHTVDESRLPAVQAAVTAIQGQAPGTSEEAALARIFMAGVATINGAYGSKPVIAPARFIGGPRRG